MWRGDAMTTKKVGRVCLAVEIDGKPCFVALPQERLLMLVKMAAGLSDTGSLPVIEAPGFRFEELRRDDLISANQI